MNVHEAYCAKSREHPFEVQGDRDTFKEQMLQLSWFDSLCRSYYGEDEMRVLLDTIIQKSPEQRDRIEKATSDEKREIVIEDMINSSAGYAEAEWFRMHFPKDSTDKKRPLAKEYQKLLERFESDPEGVNQQLNKLFQESLTTH
ncbi:MAG: hypothetical protein Q8O53_00375 [Candidatus Moranbacteria bacterium]|nr:hypothetical protein [Candidatus Moranbacteria bacterium]